MTGAAPGAGGTVVAVIVTRDRPVLLAQSLAAIAGQSRRPEHVIVVDNGPDDAVRKTVESSGLPVTYLPSRRNLGGAGSR